MTYTYILKNQNNMFRPFVIIIMFYQTLKIVTQSRDLCSNNLKCLIKSDDGHEWPKHVVFLIFKNIHPFEHTQLCLTIHLFILLCIRITSKKIFSSKFSDCVLIEQNSNAHRLYSSLRKFVGSEVTPKHVSRIFFGFPCQSSFHHCSTAIYHWPCGAQYLQPGSTLSLPRSLS